MESFINLLIEKQNQAAVGGLVSEDQLVLFIVEFNSLQLK